MTGPYDSVIGVESERIVERFLTGLPIRFAPSEGDPRLSGVLVAVDRASGRALRIEALHERVDDLAGEG